MGARGGGGGRGGRGGGGGRMLTPKDMKEAKQSVSTAQAGVSRAHKSPNVAMGEFHMAQTSAVKKSAIAKINKAQDALTKAQSKLDTAQKSLAAKSKAYQSGKKYNGN